MAYPKSVPDMYQTAFHTVLIFKLKLDFHKKKILEYFLKPDGVGPVDIRPSTD